MTKLIINGGKALKGTITPVANKNSVIKMIPAALLTDEIVTIHNVPMSSDVKYMCQIVEKLGGKVEYLNNNTTLKIDCSTVNRFDIDPELSDKMKASVMFLGPLLIKFGKAQMPTPQGCKLGTRPLDSLIQNMIDIGADYKHENGNYYLSIDQSKISGKEIRSRFPSVTGTENLIIFATKIQGTTIIYNAACEPHTQELCHFLNAMGANISGIGSNKIIIEGVGHLKGVEWTVDSDHLDVGGFIAATVMTGGELTIKNAVVKHMDMILQVYKKLGVTVEIDRAKDEIFVPKNQKLVIDKTVKGDLFDIKALHRPLFPADLIHVASVLALKAQGSAIFINSFYEYSFFFVEELAKMKALTVMADPMRIITFGPTQFKPANLISPNIIQASYAMVICALAAEGKSVISEVEPLFRRYPDIDKQFNSIGADIEIIRE